MSTSFYAIVRRRSFINYNSEVVYPKTLGKSSYSEFRSLLNEIFQKLKYLYMQGQYDGIIEVVLYANGKSFRTIKTNGCGITVKDIFQKGDYYSFQQIFDTLSKSLFTYKEIFMPKVGVKLNSNPTMVKKKYPKTLSENQDRRTIGCYGYGNLIERSYTLGRELKWRGTIIYTGMI